MVYRLLFVSFVLLFLYDLVKRKESVRLAAVMGLALFLLVALRSSTVGPDTENYITLYHTGIYGSDYRVMEPLFLAWNSLWKNIYFSGQMYLVMCALASVGLSLWAIWKSSRQRVWSYALFLVAFSWYFYLSGIRQGMAMGCFTMGVYLLNKNIDIISFTARDNDRLPSGKKKKGWFKRVLRRELGKLFKKENIGALVFLVLSPFFHLSALFAIAVLLFVLVFNGNRTFYMVAIGVSFLIVVSGVFKSAEQLFDRAFMVVAGDNSMAERYEGYLDVEYKYDIGLYLVVKSLLPVNFIAMMSLYFRNRRYRMPERLFFWMVIIYNLFFYFSYTFRLVMFLYPMACIAVSNLLAPVMMKKKLGVYHIIIAIFVILCAYVSYTNLVAQPEFDYSFCF